MTYTEAIQALECLYAKVPHIDCQGLCGHSCGPIGMSILEFSRVRQHTPLSLKGKTHHCPLLKNGRCAVYPFRPMVCRQWGVLESLPCPHGCEPNKQLTSEEGMALLHQVQQVSEMLFPGKPPFFTHSRERMWEVALDSAEHLTTRRMFWVTPQERLRLLAQEDRDG